LLSRCRIHVVMIAYHGDSSSAGYRWEGGRDRS
jgi:hypothetical protein